MHRNKEKIVSLCNYKN